jgi:ferredoxin
VPVKLNQSIDYKHYRSNYAIPYNQPLPVTPLKCFFLPIQENVVFSKSFHNKRLVIGIPSCDLHALELLDEIYLQEPYPDPLYKENRENTILVGTDCHTIQPSCHCTTYGGEPFPVMNADLNLVNLDDSLLITIFTAKGEALIRQYRQHFHSGSPDPEKLRMAETRRSAIKNMLAQQNHDLPDYPTTGDLVLNAGEEIWDKHAKTCVSCGACATICPTCTCFLLIDRPGFEKVRQVDACQYPGFERIAAGEDPLHRKSMRFRNRYLCKYVWKPERFKSVACTGCGRCIDCCIGKISKNEIFLELSQQS